MSLIRSDKYHFRRVLRNVLMLPGIVVWLYVLLFLVSSSSVAALLALLLGLGTAFILAYGIHLVGDSIVAWLDSSLGRRDDE